ncbi:hypothetical protein KJ665_02010 [Patescibacteria group bacterium]|nr:hypothetical protein [Patescibacteria group bacterium]
MPNSPRQNPLEEKLEQKLADVRLREEESRAQLLAAKLKLPYLNLTAVPINSDALFLISEKTPSPAKLSLSARPRII